MKRQFPQWEKLLTLHISDKWLTFRICKYSLLINKKKTNSPIEKLANDWKPMFHRRGFINGHKCTESVHHH